MQRTARAGRPRASRAARAPPRERRARAQSRPDPARPRRAQFRLDYALSREQTNQRGGKMYIQDKMEEYADEVFDLLDNGAHIYFCGLKGMMPGAPARAAPRPFEP